MSGNNSSEPQQRLTPPRAPGDPPSPTESELGSNSSVSNPQRSTQPSNPPSAPPSSNFFSDWQLFRAPEPTSYGSETTTEGEESQTAEESLRVILTSWRNETPRTRSEYEAREAGNEGSGQGESPGMTGEARRNSDVSAMDLGDDGARIDGSEESRQEGNGEESENETGQRRG